MQLYKTAEEAFGTEILIVNSAGLNMSGIKLVDMALNRSDWMDLFGPLRPVPDLS